MSRRSPRVRLAVALAIAFATGATGATEPPVCRNATGTSGGYFYTFWHDTGTGCIRLGSGGRYGVDWQLGGRGNLVAGKGWARGSATRVVRYNARVFDPGANGYLALYGWSTSPLVEYYVVDNWGGFEPPGKDGTFLGTVDSDGGTYRLYRTQRVNQPSIAGTATFNQYWSVRTTRRPVGRDSTISFGNHVAAWRKAGLALGTLRYQVLATEGFGSDGRSDVTVAER
jgi:endo-1,4-beta-xylanase